MKKRERGLACIALNGSTCKVLHAGSEPKIQRSDVTRTGKFRCFQLEEIPELLDQLGEKDILQQRLEDVQR